LNNNDGFLGLSQRVVVITGTALTLLNLVLLVVPLLPSIFDPNFYPYGDDAVIEIYTLHATRFSQLLGPYSRYGWNHPGPFMFYLFVPLYVLSGKLSGMLFFAAFAINVLAIFAILFLLATLIESRFPLIVSLAILNLLIAGLGREVLVNSWNPYLLITPCLLLLLLLASFAQGNVTLLPLIAVIATFLMQTHIGIIPAVGAMIVLAIILFIARHKSSSESSDEEPHRTIHKGSILSLVLTVLIVLVLWLPPCIEELNHDPGNLIRLLNFFTNQGTTVSAKESIATVVGQIFSPFMILCGITEESRIWKWQGGLFLLILCASLIAGYKQQRYSMVFICWLSLTGISVALLSALKTRDQVMGYMFFWTGAFGAAVLFAASHTILLWLLSIFRQKNLRIARTVLILFIVFFCVWAYGSSFLHILRDSTNPLREVYDMERMYEKLKTRLTEAPKQDFHVRLVDGNSWPLATGIILQLYKHNMEFSIEKDWLFMFGPQFKESENKPGKEIQFLTHPLSFVEMRNKGLELVTSGEGLGRELFIYVLDPRKIRPLLLDSTELRVVETFKTHGNPALVSDGIIPEDGVDFNDEQCLILLDDDSYVTLSVPVQRTDYKGILISADGNDTYTVSGKYGDEPFSEIGILAEQKGYGMRTRMCVIDNLSSYSVIRISPRSGDGYYSIGEVSFLVSKE